MIVCKSLAKMLLLFAMSHQYKIYTVPLIKTIQQQMAIGM